MMTQQDPRSEGRLWGNPPHSLRAAVATAQRRFQTFPPSPRNGEVRP